MERKIISFGRNSYIISIPKEWVLKNELNKGDKIFISEMNNNLIISPSRNEKKEKVFLISTQNKDISKIEREIISAYINNSTLIKIQGDNVKDIFKGLRNIIKNLFGMEIIEESSNKIVLRNFINNEKISLNNIIKRIDILVRTMIEDMILSFDNKELYENLYQRDDDINSLTYFALRLIKSNISNNKISNEYLLNAWVIVMHLENIADAAKRIARHNKESALKGKELNELKEISKLIPKYYNMVMKAFYKNNKDLCESVITGSNEIIEKSNELLKKIKDIKASIIIDIIKSIRFSLKSIALTILNNGI